MDHPFSYSSVVRSGLRKRAIFAIENLTGRQALLRLTRGAEAEFGKKQSFWDVMCSRFNITICATPKPSVIPATGPVLIIANHPNGILDGLVLGQILQSVRPDFKILAQSVFTQVDAINDNILPVSFGETDAATAINLQTRRDAMNHLKNGGCICVFPAGGVSTSRGFFGQAKDTRWRNFSAKLALVPHITVIPVYLHGQNSRLFQIISHLSDTLRKAMLLSQFRRRIGSTAHVTIGAPLARSDLRGHATDQTALMEYLYQQTYALAPSQQVPDGYGFEFDKRYR